MAQLWLFVGVLLCQSGLTNAECQWKYTPSSTASGGKQGKGAIREECKDNCRADATCKGFNFQRLPTPATCWYFNTVEVLTFDFFSDHYDWICDDDPCGANPCRNGATCIANGKSYQCSCQSEYTGNHCEMKRGCQWKEYLNSVCSDGLYRPTDIDTLEKCQTDCLLLKNCVAVDWHYKTNTCSFHSSLNQPQKSEDSNHYAWVCNG